MSKLQPEPDADTPTQAEFIRRLASLPHTADDGPATTLEMGGALSILNQAIECAREIVKRDKIKPPQATGTGRNRPLSDPTVEVEG